MTTSIKHVFHWEFRVYDFEIVTHLKAEKTLCLPGFLPAGISIIASTSSLFDDDYFIGSDYVHSFTIETEEADVYLPEISYDQQESRTANLVQKITCYLLSNGWKVETQVEKTEDKVADDQ